MELIPGGRGVFDVVVDGDQVFSKHEARRHADPGEVVLLISQR